MKETDFKKGLEDMQSIKLTDAERALILERVLATPIPSPYARYMHILVYVKRPLALAALCLVLSGSVVYASQSALPGQVLYAIKTQVVEPMIGAFTFVPEKQLAWEEEKVERRIAEAEALVGENKLDDRKNQEIERKIQKSSEAFVTAAEKISEKTATTTAKQQEKREELKQKFKERLEEKNKENPHEKVRELKEKALKALDKGKNEKGR